MSGLMPGCAAPVQRIGGPHAGWPEGGARSFVMAPAEGAGDATAVAAVRDALLAAGFQPSDGARYLVEVGFVVRDRRIDVAESVPGSHAFPALCRRQGYALSVALVDRTTGRVAMRSGAVAIRCRAAAETIIPVLAHVALTPAGS